MKSVIGEIIPVIILFVFVCYPVEMAHLSETSLGKLFFISLILFYGASEPIYGLFVCVLVLVYYQMGYLEHILSTERNMLLQESMAVMNSDLIQDLQMANVPKQVYLSKLGSYSTNDPSVFAYEPFDKIVDYNESIITGSNKKAELMAAFRRENCSNGQLVKDGLPVRREMVDHVFREIHFADEFAKCNPCDPKCNFSILETRLATEEVLVKPKSSKEEAGQDWNSIFGNVDFRPFESMMDDVRSLSEYFS